MKAYLDELIDQFEQKLSNNLSSFVKFIDNEKSQLIVLLKKSADYVTHAYDLLYNRPPCDVTREYSALQKRLGELMEQTYNAENVCIPEVVIKPTDVFDKMSSYILEKSPCE
jgi:hypothetical protein